LLRSTRVPRTSGIRRAIASAGERVNLVAGRQQIGFFEVAYTDFTELRYADGRFKAYSVPIVGHRSRMVWGWSVGDRADSDLALGAWRGVEEMLASLGIEYRELIVHHDRDPVYTGYRWTAQLLV